MNNENLFIGDLHIQPSNLEDSRLLFEYIHEILKKNPNIDTVTLLGDVLHTHSVVKQEPAFFVKRFISELKMMYPNVRWIAIAGNHDHSTPTAVNPDNALRLILGELIEIVDCGYYRAGPYIYMPFYGDNEKFINLSRAAKKAYPDVDILVCHQTFDGSKYETNTTAAHGIDQNLIPFKLIISGHIHTRQKLINNHNEVYYIGTPRALNANEINLEKFISSYAPSIAWWSDYPTNHLVKCFVGRTLTQGTDNLIVDLQGTKEKDDIRVFVEGNEEFYQEVLEKNKDLIGKVRFVPNIRKTLSKTLDVESSGTSLDAALHTYVHKVYDISDDLRKDVWQKMQTLMPNLGDKI